ncbi:MAG: Jag N-terminal domain-containing protein, partial [Selenomonadaceae bacterium]|nr:Jag N-terminal domain-containing protein [Selenomonadaceae bacterium]
MAQPVEFTGKSVEDALQTALNQLGVGKDDVDVEVLETPSKGIFGFFGTKPAKIKVTVKELPKVEPAAEQVEEGEEVIVEPPTIVNFKVVPVIEDLPKVDEKFVEEDAPQVKPSPVNPFLRDEVINKAKKFLSDLFGAINMDIKISAHEVDDNIILDLSGEESRVIIGKHGQTIDALQYLTNLAANGNSEDKVRFILDVGNYRERREETLQKLAR